MNLAAIERRALEGTVKGVPRTGENVTLGEIGRLGWNALAGDLPLPAALVKRAAVAHNGDWMRRFLAMTGSKIAPHGKTTMCPQLFARQLADGAWGITVATVGQLMVCRRFGASRLLLANQLVGRLDIDAVLDELRRNPGFDFYCLVDSLDGARIVAEAARARPVGRPVQLLLEVGHPGGRTGCRSIDQALAVARAVAAAAPHLALTGVEGFEGIITGETPAAQDAAVTGFLERIVNTARACAAEELFAAGPILLSAGGSAFFDLAATRLRGRIGERSVDVVLRSGCYLTHDSGSYRALVERLMARMPAASSLGEGLRPALEVWAHVQSRPEPTRVIATMGKRDVGSDTGLPVPERWARPGSGATARPVGDGSRVVALNDQHALVDVPASSPLAVGDMLGFGVSHPCTTFDRWQLLYEVDDAYNVVGGLKTFF